MPSSVISWEALHLSTHTNSLCAAQSALITIRSTTPLDRNGAGSVADGIVRGQPEKRWWCDERAGVMRRRQPFSQSGLSRTEPCVAGESDTNIWPNWAQHQCAVDLKAARRHKRRFLWRRCIQADAQSRRSRTAAAWKPHRDPAGFSRVLRDADLRSSRCDGIELDSSFICWSWIFWRAPPVSQAVTCYRSRCASFGTPELSPVGPIFMLSECSQCSHPPWEKISTDPTSFDLASCFICKVNPIFYLFSELWSVNSSGGTVLPFVRRSPNLKCFRFSLIATGAMAQTHQPKDLHQGQKTLLICQEALSGSSFLFLVYPWRRSSPLFAPPPQNPPKTVIKPVWSAVGYMQKAAFGIYCAFYHQAGWCDRLPHC